MYQTYTPVKLPGTGEIVGTGWLRSLPSLSDYTENHDKVLDITKGLLSKDVTKPLPSKVDLRQWCSPIQNQLNLGSCTAHATAGIVEYFQIRSFKKFTPVSRLFIYKTERNLMGVTGDTGGELKVAMAALKMFGAPPEKYWPYTDQSPIFDVEPSSFVYALGSNFQAVTYFTHDPNGTPFDQVLVSVKNYLNNGIPSMFGFTGFSTAFNSNIPGSFPMPDKSEQPEWGHAIAAFGYDDTIKITNTKTNQSTTGALLIRNSWSEQFGDKGYGWLPYAYVLNGLAVDFWSLLSSEWLDTGQFGL